jgi:hypothetical protein
MNYSWLLGGVNPYLMGAGAVASIYGATRKIPTYDPNSYKDFYSEGAVNTQFSPIHEAIDQELRRTRGQATERWGSRGLSYSPGYGSNMENIEGNAINKLAEAKTGIVNNEMTNAHRMAYADYQKKADTAQANKAMWTNLGASLIGLPIKEKMEADKMTNTVKYMQQLGLIPRDKVATLAYLKQSGVSDSVLKYYELTGLLGDTEDWNSYGQNPNGQNPFGTSNYPQFNGGQ